MLFSFWTCPRARVFALCHGLIRAAEISAYSHTQLCRCLLLAAHDLAVIHRICPASPLAPAKDLFAGTGSPLGPAKDCSGPSIITSSGSNASSLSESSHRGDSLQPFLSSFQSDSIGLIPGANPHTVLGSDHASLDDNDYLRLRVIQRCQAVFTFLLAQHRVRDFNFHHGCVSSFISILLHLLFLFSVPTVNHRVIPIFRLSLHFRELSM